MAARRPMHLSLRTKLAFTLGAAALIPLGLVSAVGLRVSLGRLDRSLTVQARQTAQIALNLLLRQVQRTSREATHMASEPELHELLALEPSLVSGYLDAFLETSEPGLVEVVLKDRRVAARGATGEISRFERIGVRRDSPALVRALDYERQLTIAELGGQLCIQASAPVVDSTFVLRGAVVMTIPLDEQMADYIKSVVRADIAFLTSAKALASTFVDATGQRLAGPAPPEGLAERILRRGDTAVTVQKVAGHEYAVVYAPLQAVSGERLGIMAVAISREGLSRAQASAIRSLALGGAGSLIFALVLAYIFGRRITIPLERLHRSTRAVAAGDLEQDVAVETQDEIGDLARAFQTMTTALREHRERLAARVREILTLHQIGRAVSSVLSLDQVLHLVVTEVASVLGAERGALLLQDQDSSLCLRDEVGLPRIDGAAQLPPTWVEMASTVLARHAATVEGNVLAVPLETRERGVGALIMARRERGGPYSEADLRLVVTFADQAATAIENARLYGEVSAFSAELEDTVRKRTAELRSTNEELAHALNDLRDTQAALIQQARMAGLGLLVAGIAHEINTPAGAIQGSAQVLGETLQRLVGRMSQFVESDISGEEASRVFEQIEQSRRSLAQLGMLPPAEMRRRARELSAVLEEHGVADAKHLAKRLLESGAAGMAAQVAKMKDRVSPELMVGMIEDLAFLEQSTLSIKAAIRALVRLVGALKSYAHTDQEAIADVDITESLETTLTILHNQLRYGITVNKLYAPLPKVSVYMDQLNQVWTNLIHNAVQAMNGKGELTLETFQDGQEIGVRVIDNGPGIPPSVMPRIFEPFFTTKPPGEGTGLGLGIVQQIVEKHGGRIEVESRPGRTCFTVLLPLSGPPPERTGAGNEGENEDKGQGRSGPASGTMPDAGRTEPNASS